MADVHFGRGTTRRAWIALSEGPDRDYLDASGRNAEQALRRLSDRLRVARGSTTG